MAEQSMTREGDDKVVPSHSNDLRPIAAFPEDRYLALLQIAKRKWFPDLQLAQNREPPRAAFLTFIKEKKVPEVEKVDDVSGLRNHLDKLNTAAHPNGAGASTHEPGLIHHQLAETLIVVDPPISTSVRLMGTTPESPERQVFPPDAGATYSESPAKSRVIVGRMHPYNYMDVLSLDRLDWNAWQDLQLWSDWNSWAEEPGRDALHRPELPARLPRMLSTFDDILLLFSSGLYAPAATASGCTEVGRRLALSAWTAYLRVVESHLIGFGFKVSLGSATRDDILKTDLLDTLWTTPWANRTFGSIIEAKLMLKMDSYHLGHNIRMLRVGRDTVTVGDWETEEWKGLLVVLERLEKTLDSYGEAYVQAVENNNARDVGFLTSLATIFVPVSLVAGILSMGGEFAAGQNRFWVFWASSVPLIIVGLVFLFTPIARSAQGSTGRWIRWIKGAFDPVKSMWGKSGKGKEKGRRVIV
ncbi:hypothetical protein DL764_001907 [Monosporascus ibericus]|uniref:Uncharacterized protein n=1 Tax=Monosporascus ibericus TaxID=155417 RepID=A0A4V1XC40_9PEZI|nr:hypothetical protein DL764_001907 [Monosporascus ibericus]